MSCSICRNEKLKSLVDSLFAQGLSYRKIQHELRGINIPMSLSMLSKHFTHQINERLKDIEVPAMNENEKSLTKEEMSRLCDIITTFWMESLDSQQQVSLKEGIDLLVRQVEAQPQKPSLSTETNITYYNDIIFRISLLIPKLVEPTKAKYLDSLKQLGIPAPKL